MPAAVVVDHREMRRFICARHPVCAARYAQQITAISDDCDDVGIRLRELRSDRCSDAPPQSGTAAREETAGAAHAQDRRNGFSARRLLEQYDGPVIYQSAD